MSATAGTRKERRDAEIEHLAYALRGKEGPETRSAKLGDNRVDFIRGKDFFAALGERDDVLDEHAMIDGKEHHWRRKGVEQTSSALQA